MLSQGDELQLGWVCPMCYATFVPYACCLKFKDPTGFENTGLTCSPGTAPVVWLCRLAA